MKAALALFLASAITLPLLPGSSAQAFDSANLKADFAAKDLPARPAGYVTGRVHTDRYAMRTVFQAKKPLKNVTFQTIEFLKTEGPNDEIIVFRAKKDLYSQPELVPGKPLLVGISVPGDMPTTAISFTGPDGKVQSYGIQLSGMDGSLVLTKITLEKNAGAQATGFKVYDAKIAEYRKALSMGQEKFRAAEMGNESINAVMVGYAYDGGAEFCYALHDLNGDGTPELLFTSKVPEMPACIIDIYTLRNGKAVKLFKECIYGERSRLHLLSDGSLVDEGSGGASMSACDVYRLDAQNRPSRTGGFYFSSEGRDSEMKNYQYVSEDQYRKKLDALLKTSMYGKLDWKAFAKVAAPTE